MGREPRQRLIQEGQYAFPYHLIPYEDKGVWRVSKDLRWGYEYLAVLETAIELTIAHRPRRVLDFGCGEGRLITELRKRGIDEVIGLDHSDRALSIAKGIVGQDQGVRLVRDLKEVAGDQFDAIFAIDVLEHIPPDEMTHLLSQLRQVLKDDGTLIISVPTTNVALNPKHYRHFSLEDIEQITRGLFIIAQVRFIHRLGLLARVIQRLLVNRFVIPVWRPWLWFTTALYRRYVAAAEGSTGAHLVALLRKMTG